MPSFNLYYNLNIQLDHNLHYLITYRKHDSERHVPQFYDVTHYKVIYKKKVIDFYIHENQLDKYHVL